MSTTFMGDCFEGQGHASVIALSLSDQSTMMFSESWLDCFGADVHDEDADATPNPAPEPLSKDACLNTGLKSKSYRGELALTKNCSRRSFNKFSLP